MNAFIKLSDMLELIDEKKEEEGWKSVSAVTISFSFRL